MWTERGKSGLVHGLGILDALGAELEAEVGGEALATAHAVLLAAIARYEPSGA